MIFKIRIHFVTKTEPIEIVSNSERQIVNACERGSFYSVLFTNEKYTKFPIQHIYKIEEIRQPDFDALKVMDTLLELGSEANKEVISTWAGVRRMHN